MKIIFITVALLMSLVVNAKMLISDNEMIKLEDNNISVAFSPLNDITIVLSQVDDSEILRKIYPSEIKSKNCTFKVANIDIKKDRVKFNIASGICALGNENIRLNNLHIVGKDGNEYFLLKREDKLLTFSNGNSVLLVFGKMQD